MIFIIPLKYVGFQLNFRLMSCKKARKFTLVQKAIMVCLLVFSTCSFLHDIHLIGNPCNPGVQKIVNNVYYLRQ